MGSKWFEKPVRMMRWDLLGEYEKVKTLDLDAWAREKREKWHCNCEWLVGVPGQAPGTGHLTAFNAEGFERYPGFEEFDLLREYLPYARKYGIKAIAYLNMHWYSYDFAAKHLGWEQLTSTGESYGRLYPLYGNGTTLCVNSPWRDWAFSLIEETMKTGVDGVLLDGPVVFPDCCYCEHCQEKFRRKYGEPIPKEDWKSDLWKEFVMFREESLADFLRDARSSVREVNPDGVIFLNAGGWHASGWRVARDIQKVGPHQDFNGAEEFFHPRTTVQNLFASAIMAKYLVAGGKPAIVYTHHALGAWHYKFLPPWELKLAIAQTVACGANPWFAFFGRAYDNDDTGAQAAGEIQGFLERNEEYYEGSRSTATVALHHSAQTGTFYLSEQAELYRDLGTGKEQDLIADLGKGKTAVDWKKRKATCEDLLAASFQGYCNILLRQHIPFDVVLDMGITEENLRRYETLILPNSACLSDQQVQAIEGFVDNGGNLFASFESGVFDEKGNVREIPALDDLLGIESREGMFRAMLGENYMRVVTPSWPFDAGDLLPRGPHCLKVTTDKDSTAPIVFLEPIPSFYTPLTKESRYPAMVLRSHGKGKTAYSPQLLGAFYGTYRVEHIEQLVVGTVKGLSRRMPMEVEAPPTVLVEVRTQIRPHNRTLIHMVNCSGDMQRPLSTIIPVRDVAVKLRDPSASKARKLSDNKEVQLERQGAWCQFRLPNLDFYEVVVVE